MNNKYVTYKKLQSGNEKDFHDLVLLFNDVFETENDANHENIRKLLNNPSFVCLAALHHHKVIGGITAYELMSYDKAGSVMYVYDLAVKNSHQRSGIGGRLVSELLADCRNKGIKELFVQAEEADAHAVHFYQKLGGESFQTRQFHFNL
ncbi:AAC(3)-I family aminoglycoside 3-N-acetyltransferase [Pueribacillus theae]|uniref:AAC(3)-I family aminoglycoside 3-N-acetyltransferase n=1 Tax=Pueribacillus theae TaxID=2171751 RepID=A0A2U1JSJ6_9BACI|nr:GNAT family N-acetyltransferase [Pueribacillus theae]PWA08176.1 AAC(3)-I family aminoglycoside 3-N-acetyltransferase [Pueribacillus theae]